MSTKDALPFQFKDHGDAETKLEVLTMNSNKYLSDVKLLLFISVKSRNVCFMQTEVHFLDVKWIVLKLSWEHTPSSHIILTVICLMNEHYSRATKECSVPKRTPYF